MDVFGVIGCNDDYPEVTTGQRDLVHYPDQPIVGIHPAGSSQICMAVHSGKIVLRVFHAHPSTPLDFLVVNKDGEQLNSPRDVMSTISMAVWEAKQLLDDVLPSWPDSSWYFWEGEGEGEHPQSWERRPKIVGRLSKWLYNVRRYNVAGNPVIGGHTAHSCHASPEMLFALLEWENKEFQSTRAEFDIRAASFAARRARVMP